jgi:DNA-binding NarL/FixJ family response regulator
MSIKQLVLVDADDISRNGIAAILQAADLPLEVIETFPTLNGCETWLVTHIPDLLLINDALPEVPDIVPFIERLHAHHPALAVIIISDHLNVAYIQTLFKHGVAGFLLREMHFAKRLVQAVVTVTRGEWYLSPRASRLVYTGEKPKTFETLSRRDLEVARSMYAGYTVQEIAQQLGISDQAVYRARRKLRECLQVQTSEQIIAAALEKGLLQAGD